MTQDRLIAFLKSVDARRRREIHDALKKAGVDVRWVVASGAQIRRADFQKAMKVLDELNVDTIPF